MDFLRAHDNILIYFDNDEAGKKTTQSITENVTADGIVFHPGITGMSIITAAASKRLKTDSELAQGSGQAHYRNANRQTG